MDTLEQVRDHDGDPSVVNLAGWLFGVIERQFHQGPGRPIPAGFGAEGPVRTPASGLEEMTPTRFLERYDPLLTPVQRAWNPVGAKTAWVMPLGSPVNLYAQGPAMAAGLEERLKQVGLGADSARVIQSPLAVGLSYQQPGVFVLDAALGRGMENPLQLVAFTFRVSDLERFHPAALILAALGVRQDPTVKILGMMVVQDVEGQVLLVIFA